jgi:large subunit ribosomal protein L5
MVPVKEKQNKAFEALKGPFGYKNKQQSPKLVKVAVNVGVGSVKDKAKVELIQDRLAKITGQKAAPRSAKKSIATFKVRQGDIVGYQITLRGPKMHAFLDRLLNASIPRTKDFRGLSRFSVDEMGNYTLAVKEHTIFPETSGEDIKDIFGFSVTVVTTAKTPKESIAFLEELGFPFKKPEDDQKKAPKQRRRR